MKKIISLFLIIIMCLPLFACNTAQSDPQHNSLSVGNSSARVQKISYEKSSTSKEIMYSKFYFDLEYEEVTKEEYDNATNKVEGYTNSGIIEADGTAYAFGNNCTVKELEQFIGKTYYLNSSNDFLLGSPTIYKKITCTALHLSYLDVTFFDDGSFEVSYYDKNSNAITTKRIKTDNYEMVYFNTEK